VLEPAFLQYISYVETSAATPWEALASSAFTTRYRWDASVELADPDEAFR
jgi:hypothetical protein